MGEISILLSKAEM